MISRVTRAFVSTESVAQSFHLRRRGALPSNVDGHTCFSTTGARFDCVWCDGFVLVTSRKPVSSALRPDPWQLGHVVVLPNEFAILRSPPHVPHVSMLFIVRV